MRSIHGDVDRVFKVKLSGVDRTGSRIVLNEDRNGRSIDLTPENYSQGEMTEMVGNTVAVSIFTKSLADNESAKTFLAKVFPDFEGTVKSGETKTGGYYVQQEKVAPVDDFAYLLECMPQ